jgi:hypothetical protein
MREDAFKAWLLAEGFTKGTISTQMSKVRKLDRIFGDLDQLHASGTIEDLERRLRSRFDLPNGLGNDGELGHLPKSLDYYRQFIEGRRTGRRAASSVRLGAEPAASPIPERLASNELPARSADKALDPEYGTDHGLAELLAEVCRLQPSYTPENSPAMQRRGALIRSHIPASLRLISDRFREALGGHGPEMRFDASDGIGRKTEAPWVRIHSTRLSPSPRDGFYVVVHFSADGAAVFITIGCGSTVWANGELRPVSDAELQRRTDWARQEVVRVTGSLEPFTDEISLGARAALPRTFEKATAFAKRIPRAELTDSLVEDLLVDAADRLRIIYDAQDIGADLSEPEQVELTLEGRGGSRGGGGQGFGLTALEKKSVEERAMALAKAWLESLHFVADDTSKTAPYDFLATRVDEVFKIEVKGTTSEFGDAITVTKNEFELHRRELGRTGLIVVSGIRLDRSGDVPIASGGQLTAELGWNIDDWEAVPIAYRLSRKSIS